MVPKSDWMNIQHSLQNYEKQCNRSEGFSNQICSANLYTLKASAENVRRLIGEFQETPNIRSRNRRSIENDGILLHLWRLLFGYHQNKPSYEAIQHLSKAQQLTKNHQVKMEEKVNSQLLVLEAAVNEYEQTFDNRDAELKQSIQFQHAHALINEHLEYVFEKYTEVVITNEEIHTMLEKLKADQIHVPNLSVGQWRKLIKTKVIMKQKEIIYEVVWPILHKDTMKIFKVIPTPSDNGEILNFEPKIVIMNTVTKMYAEEFQVLNKLNVTHQVIETSRLKKLSVNSSCPVAITMNEKSMLCSYKKLPKEYDEWISIIPNVYFFACNIAKEKICHPNSRISIEGITGTVTLTKNCFISTANHYIDYIEDYQDSANISSFHIPEQTWNLENRTQHKVIKIGSPIKFKDEQIQDEIDIANQVNIPESENGSFVAIIIVSSIATVAVIILLGIYCKYRSKDKSASTTVNIEMKPSASNEEQQVIRTPPSSPNARI
jgi:hypothetical protein